MYNILRDWITRKKFKTLDEALRKLTIYNMGGVITDDEYLELAALAREVYEA